MRNKFTALLLTVVLFILPGCTLAREPSPQQGEDQELAGARFVGVYVVREDPFAQIDRAHWVEYGSSKADSELGVVLFPSMILVGEYDGEARKFVFPGLEGLSCFVVTKQLENGAPSSLFYNELHGGSFHHNSTDAGSSYELEATLYYGAPLGDPDYDPWEDDRVWRHYKVYQMEDGTIFLTGHGDSHSGGTGIALTQTETYTVTVDGEETEVYTTVEVAVEYIERLTAVTVRQYSAEGDKLAEVTFDPAEEVPAVTWHPDAVWAMVEEVDADGTVTRTAYERPGEDGEEVAHTLILLDEEGMGYGVTLRIESERGGQQ